MKIYLPKISFKKTSQNTNSSGQIGLVVILIMVVVLTVGLSVASRSSQEVEIASQEESSTRVFNAAETGIEDALSSILQAEEAGVTPGAGGVGLPLNGVNRQHSIALSNSLETHLDEGVSAEINLTTLATGNLEIQWSRQTCAQSPASLLVAVFSDESGTTIAKQYALNVNNCTLSNNFDYATTDPTDPYLGTFSIPITNGLLVRIKPIYNDTDNFIPVSTLVSEAQYNIVAQAQNTSETKETTAISAKRTIPAASAFMDYAIVSGDTIIKN